MDTSLLTADIKNLGPQPHCGPGTVRGESGPGRVPIPFSPLVLDGSPRRGGLRAPCGTARGRQPQTPTQPDDSNEQRMLAQIQHDRRACQWDCPALRRLALESPHTVIGRTAER